MIIRIKQLCLIILLGIGLRGLHAQEAMSVTGGNASGSGGSVSYSVGQVFYTANTGSNGSIAQGVQQPYEISVISGIEEFKGITMKCTAYPNPTTDCLTLKVDAATAFSVQPLSFQLYDINGKLLENKIIEADETTINMVNYASAAYFLKVIQNNKEIKTFKIIKN
jgi:hypothetical protein